MPVASDQAIANKPKTTTSPQTRLIRSVLVSTVIVVGWLLFNYISDRCWFFVNGNEYILTQSATLFIWLFVFCAVRMPLKIVLVAATLIYLLQGGIPERFMIGAAEGNAAQTLRKSCNALEKMRAENPGHEYPVGLPPSVTVYFDDQKYYKFQYVPRRSKADGPIDMFELHARPVRYYCGYKDSFLITEASEVHFTLEDRKATLADPSQ